MTTIQKSGSGTRWFLTQLNKIFFYFYEASDLFVILSNKMLKSYYRIGSNKENIIQFQEVR